MNEISHALRAILVMNYKIMEMDNSISIIFLPKSNDFYFLFSILLFEL